MKKTNILSIILVALIAISITSSAYAVPMSINYQGKLTDPNGSVLNGEYQMSFSLFNTDTNGTALWSEQQTIMVADGIYNVQLGAVNPLTAIILNNEDLYLEVGIESETLSTRQRLTSVAFAIRAKEAETVGGYHASNFVVTGQTGSITSDMIVDGSTLSEILDDDGSGSSLDADLLDGKDSSEFGDGHSLDAADHDPVDVLYVDANSNVSIIGLPDTDILSGTAFVDIEGFSGYKLNVNGDIYVRGQDIIFSHGDSSHEGNRNIDSISYLDGTDQWGGYVPELDSAGVFTFFADTNYRSPWDQPTAAISAKGAYFKSNVGIGTTSPLEALHIKSNDDFATSLVLQNTSIGGRDWIFRSTGSAFPPGDAGSLVIGHPGIGPAITINEIGNVGIGTTSPKSKLHVEDSIAWGNRVIQLTDSTAPGGFLGIEDGSIIAGDFIPLIHGKGVGTGIPGRIGLHLLGEPGEDGSDDAAVNIQGRLNDVALINAPILTILNYSTELMRIAASGNVGIGTTSPQGRLDVNGSIYQRGIQLHADYVFETDYKLESIEEHSKYMWENKHLKAIPKAKVDKDGKEIIEVGAHRKGIVEELEKAHIYIEQLHKRINEMEGVIAKNEALETLVSELSTRIETLESNN